MKIFGMLSIFLSLLTFVYCCKYKCGPNEEFNICGSVCEPSCAIRNFNNALCISCSKSTQGCRCKKGYLRDEKNQQCVDAEHCSKCADSERHEMCGRTCEGTCAHPFTPEICALIRCRTPPLC